MSTSSSPEGKPAAAQISRASTPSGHPSPSRRRSQSSGGCPSSSRRRSPPGDPSSSRRLSADAVWPEHFVESVATRVAVDAARDAGRAAAAPSIATVFQVCSTWRSISLSELLWEDLTRRIWFRHHRLLPTWRDEFIRLHHTACNFHTNRSVHSIIFPVSTSLSCCRIAFSDHNVATGFTDGSVRIFELLNGTHLATHSPLPHRDRLGRYSRSISGILLHLERVIFASMDGDIHVASVDPNLVPRRRAQVGNVLQDGTLTDFSGNGTLWVGLYAGVPGRSWHIWNGVTEQLVYVGGSLMNPNSRMGWEVLSDSVRPGLGRVRIVEPGLVVGINELTIQVLHVDEELVQELGRLDLRQELLVDTADACEGLVMLVDRRGICFVYVARTLEQVCHFRIMGRDEPFPMTESTVGCMNWGYLVVCTESLGGRVSVWDGLRGELLYEFRERIGNASAIAATDRYVAAWARASGLHLWDFGAL